MIGVLEVRYKADITAGALKLPESRLIADLLLRQAQRHYQLAAQAHASAPIPQRTFPGANPGLSATAIAPRPNLGLAQKQQLLQPLLKLSTSAP